MGRRILITGANGHLGRYVVRELAGVGDIVALDLSQDEIGTDQAFFQGSVLDTETLEKASEGVDAIVHLAALANIYSGTPRDIMQVNTIGTWNVLAAAEHAGVKRVVLCSSDSATGLTVRPERMKAPLYLPVDEHHPCHPTDSYSLSKRIGEQTALCFADRGTLEVVVLRPVYVFYPRVMDEIVRRTRDPAAYKPSLDPVSPKAGGGPLWHYVRPEDLARAFRQAVELEMAEPCETFFILAGETLHPEPTLERAARLFGHLPEVRDERLYRENPHAPMFSTLLAQMRLGFVAQTGMRDEVALRLNPPHA